MKSSFREQKDNNNIGTEGMEIGGVDWMGDESRR